METKSLNSCLLTVFADSLRPRIDVSKILFFSVHHRLASAHSLNHRSGVMESRPEKPKSVDGADDCL